MKTILIRSLLISISFITLLLFSTSTVMGMCTNISGPGVTQCQNNSVLFCSTPAECTSSTTSTPTQKQSSTSNLNNINPCSTVWNSMGATFRCEFSDGTVWWCPDEVTCNSIQNEQKGWPDCHKKSFQGVCDIGYSSCPQGPGYAYCCKDISKCDEYQSLIINNQSEIYIKKFDICSDLSGDLKTKCEDCRGDDPDKPIGLWTAIGCIKTNPETFVSNFLALALGIAGGIALLLMVYGAFLISISAGDPKKSEEGKEIITGVIAGLLFIIFSVFLLKLIGIDILRIPGF